MDGTQPKRRLITLPLMLTVGGMLILGTITTLLGFLTWPDLEDRDEGPPRPRIMQPAQPKQVMPQPAQATVEQPETATQQPETTGAAGEPALLPESDAGVEDAGSRASGPNATPR